jgi:hypothetical protein
MKPANRSAMVAAVHPHLGKDDDKAFWDHAIDVLVTDVESEISESGSDREIYAWFGACSHWLRPHQTRWTAAGGFAWPTGYTGGSYSRDGAPEFDWSVKFCWDLASKVWEPSERFKGKKKLIFRAALPTRTTRHDQAAVHTIWEPGSPAQTKRKTVRIYGFRKIEHEWTCVASKIVRVAK